MDKALLIIKKAQRNFSPTIKNKGLFCFLFVVSIVPLNIKTGRGATVLGFRTVQGSKLV